MDINLKSKFDIGEKVYFLNSGTIDYGVIKEITFRSVVKSKKAVVVDFYYVLFIHGTRATEKILEESKIYNTIEELTNDLIEKSTEKKN